jgi:hypothetical protein
MNRVICFGFVPLFALAAGCSSSSDATDSSEHDFSSPQSTLVTFEFDGQLDTDQVFGNGKQEIQDQMLYTIGHLNADRGVGRLDNLALSNVQVSGSHVTYHAKLPVAWPSKTRLPQSYTFTLPRDVSFNGQETFTSKYKDSCVDFSAHDVDSGSMWYYYRPHTSGCSIATEDTVTIEATVTPSSENTSGKYPEYQKVWEDGALNIVAIFGKYENGKTTADDAGISGYNAFVGAIREQFANATTIPASIPDAPGVSAPEVEVDATLDDGRTVKVNAFLVDNISQTTADFDQKYAALSAHADVIAYNGHAGLGQNVRALARKGSWVAGQYVIIFMNGCDTFAYVDGSLAQTRARINPDDPTGTKYMEFVTNAMPSFFSSMPNASMSLIKGLLSTSRPMTYDTIFKSIDPAEMVLVTGEEDNEFTPGMPIGKN